MTTNQSAKFVESALINSCSPHIKHGFFTRQGGTSTGIFTSLNAGLGSSDDTKCVIENRLRICKALDIAPSNLATAHQHHSTDVFVATCGISKDRPKADGIVSNSPNIAIGVVTADCGPVLFADAKNNVIGAAHAGWRGAFDGVLENTIAKMEALGAERSDIKACLGPCISQASYEVGPEFIERFTTKNTAFSKYFTSSTKPDHHLYDMHSFIIDQLKQSQVQTEDLRICTYENEDDYFSYRRTTHRSEADYGRQLSVITLGA